MSSTRYFASGGALLALEQGKTSGRGVRSRLTSLLQGQRAYAAAGRDVPLIGTTLVAASARRDRARSMRAKTSRIVAASGSRVTRKWWR